jgi:chemotaxis regulatin CheY-phosphate phosphatase CheZ
MTGRRRRKADRSTLTPGSGKALLARSKPPTSVLRRIHDSYTRILEALSFQDLSGQRIFKIVRLISELQLKLLSLLVSYGTKFKIKKEERVEQLTEKLKNWPRMKWIG